MFARMLTTQVPYYLLEVCFESSQKLLSFFENWMEFWSRWREMKPHGTKKLDFWELHPSEGQNSMWNQLKLAATSSLKYSRCTEEEHGNETDYRCYELRAETKRFLNASIFKKSDASNANFNKGNDVTSVLRHSMK